MSSRSLLEMIIGKVRYIAAFLGVIYSSIWNGSAIAGIPEYSCYRTVEETYASAETIVSEYPHLAAWIDIGDSWDKINHGGAAGYDLMVLKLTNVNISGPKPKLFILSSIHARDYVPAEIGTRLAEHLVANYGLDPVITWILDYHEIHLLLQGNPDARKYAETGHSWVKNTNQNYCAPTSFDRGANLDHNFSFQWGCCGGSSGSQCDTDYRGPNPASEPEVQALQNYLMSIYESRRPADLSLPAPNDTSGLLIDLHSVSEQILWPWSFTSAEAPNGAALQTLGRRLAYFNGYHPQQAINRMLAEGTVIDYAYGELGLPAYALYLGTDYFQDCTTFENIIFPDILSTLIYAARVLRAPYLTPSGPEVMDVALDDNDVVRGSVVRLSATIDDTLQGDSGGSDPIQNIHSAEYFIDMPPWESDSAPIGTVMKASDLVFNQAIEEVEATLDTAGMTVGRHILFLRGKDTSGSDGPISAIFINIRSPIAITAPINQLLLFNAE